MCANCKSPPRERICIASIPVLLRIPANKQKTRPARKMKLLLAISFSRIDFFYKKGVVIFLGVGLSSVISWTGTANTFSFLFLFRVFAGNELTFWGWRFFFRDRRSPLTSGFVECIKISPFFRTSCIFSPRLWIGIWERETINRPSLLRALQTFLYFIVREKAVSSSQKTDPRNLSKISRHCLLLDGVKREEGKWVSGDYDLVGSREMDARPIPPPFHLHWRSSSSPVSCCTHDWGLGFIN